MNTDINTAPPNPGIKYSAACCEHAAIFSIQSMKYCRHRNTFIKKKKKERKASSLAAIHSPVEDSGDCRTKAHFWNIHARTLNEMQLNIQLHHILRYFLEHSNSNTTNLTPAHAFFYQVGTVTGLKKRWGWLGVRNALIFVLSALSSNRAISKPKK